MTQKSLFWFTDGFTGATGDGAAPYTQEEFRLNNQALYGQNFANMGVWSGIANELIVSGSSSPLSVDTGRATVYGFPYWNTATVSQTVTTPSVGDTGGMIVLRADFATATVRVAVVLNSDGNAAIPALTQSAGVTWEIPLAEFVVDTSGNIWTDSGKGTAGVTDTRRFAVSPLSMGARLRTTLIGGGGGSVDWKYIQQDYKNLVIEISIPSGGGGSDAVHALAMRLNGITSNLYDYYLHSQLNGAVTAALAAQFIVAYFPVTSVTYSTGLKTVHQIIFNSYAQTGYPSWHSQGMHFTLAASQPEPYYSAGILRSAGAISRIQLYDGTSTAFIAGTVATLYGLR